MTVYGRDSQGRFISKKRAEETKQLVEKTAPTSKIVVFRERMRQTRVARIVKRAYSKEMSDEEIINDLNGQYDRGGNWVIKSTPPILGYLKPGDEQVLEVGTFGSGDES